MTISELIPVDKAFHFIAGFAVTAVLYPYFGLAILSTLAAVMAGCLKEAWDNFFGGTVDAMDFIATALGGIAAAIFHFALIAITLRFPLLHV